MTLSKTDLPKRNENFLIEKILEDEVILYNRTNHTIHSLNTTAGIVWNLCDGTLTISEIVEYLCNNCKAPKKVIETDVLQTLTEMENNNLISS